MAIENTSSLSYDELTTRATKLGTYATDMEALLKEIKTSFEDVGDDATWSGTAADAAKEKFDELSAQFHLFNEAITACKDHLNLVVENFKAVDDLLTGKQPQ